MTRTAGESGWAFHAGEVIGFSSVPQVGAEFFQHRRRKESAQHRRILAEKNQGKRTFRFFQNYLEQLYQKIKEGVKDFNVIIKADVRGSIEAINDALSKLSTNDVRLKIIHSSTGAISETDVLRLPALASPLLSALMSVRMRALPRSPNRKA